MPPPKAPQSSQRRPRPPLDQGKLDDLALRYVGRFATTRAKLRQYLDRKLRERGWAGEGAADVAAIAERLAGLGYIDDAAFAMAKTRSLSGRGYGARRVRQSLQVAGVGEADAAPAAELAEAERVDAALRFARRRRIGPFAPAPLEREAREKQIAAMIRAGHAFGLSRAIVALDPGADFTPDELAECR